MFRKKLIIDCYTYKSYVYEYAKIDKGVKFVPEWWKKAPPSYDSGSPFFQNTTIKRCPGFVNYYKNSIILPMWSDLGVTITDEEISWQYSDSQSYAEMHPSEQLAGFLPTHQHLKLQSPWVIKCDEEVQFLLETSPYGLPDGVMGVPGITDFKYQSASNINLFFRKPGTYIINHNTPILSIIPLTEREVVLRTHLVSYQEFTKLNDMNMSIVFTNKYKYIKKLYDKLHKGL